MNLGGLDWQRSKWNFLTRKYLKISERFAIKYSGQIIADNQGIKDYIMTEYGISSDVIAYGGDQVFKVIPSHNDLDKYLFLKKSYAFTVARIQPDNNIEMLCNSFDINSKFPLVIVGNWNKSIYGQKLKKALLDKSNLILLDAIYDQHQLNLLRSNCFVYLHGHSAGGTNPALVEAMNLELPIFAYDNNFNRYTTEGRAKYFIDSSSLKELLSNAYADDLKQNSIEMYSIAKFKFKWSIICSDYSKIFNK
jgi:glycosyltransferase involved in cell wall biosynthesis